ncbi:MAG: hypothetical protein ACOY4H_11880 [Thermodesulfobacteriota bacterium]
MTDRELVNMLGPFVQAIVGATSTESVEFVGSGFLLKQNNTIKLVTAAHVLDHHDENDSPLFIATTTGCVRVEGDAFISPIAMGAQRKDDKIDLAVVILGADSCTKLREISFVSYDMLDINNVHDRTLGYFAMGFPVKKSNKLIDQANKVLEPEIYGFHVEEAEDRIYEKLGVSQASHLVLNFNKKKMFSETGGQRTAPDLNGLSGTPIWGLVRKSATEVKAMIVAILTEHHQGALKAVVGTRVSTRIF